tara:strand:- start:32 stop:187 length:156 start_codon:yes stop_codon:yes gene_type:complete
MRRKSWDRLSIEHQDEIGDNFFKERDLFPFNDDGTITKEFKNYLEDENFKV